MYNTKFHIMKKWYDQKFINKSLYVKIKPIKWKPDQKTDMNTKIAMEKAEFKIKV